MPILLLQACPSQHTPHCESVKKRTRNTVVGLLIIGLLATIAAIVILVMYPREITTWYTRGGLERAGLTKYVHDHDRGHITYYRGGDGPPLVFVHGLADQAGSWHQIAAEFVDDFDVIVVDLPSHGESPYRRDEEVLGDEATEILRHFFDELDDAPLTMVGNSLGGWVILEYALSRPDSVAHLVPVGSAGLEHDIDPSLLMPSDRTEARRTIRMIFGDDPPPTPGFVLDQIVERSGESIASTALEQSDDAQYLDDRLGDVNVPVDLVWGTEDLIFPVDYARQMNRGIPDSELHIIDGCGHSPQVGCPDEFTDVLRELLADAP